MTIINATSGSAVDIQTAVDLASIGDTVSIPTGTFNFVDEAPWVSVSIPAGINIAGAPTERDEDNQVVSWKTSLIMPYEATSLSHFFEYSEDSNLGFKFSDLELVGYRNIDNNSTTMYRGLRLDTAYTNYPTTGYLDFRVNHCNFRDLGGTAVGISGHAEYNRRVYRGVIDHNRFTNVVGDPGFMNYEIRTLGYGIILNRWASDLWDSTVTNVIGQYTNYSIYIEDNYFSKWRHSVSSAGGFHYVFRHNVVEGDYATASVDGHGSYADDYHPYAVGTRAIEIYGNTFKDPDTTWTAVPWAINHRGGAAIMYNNTLEDYYALCDLNNDWGNYEPYRPDCLINDSYIWGNTLNGADLIKYNADSVEDVNYFLRAPTVEDDGFTWESYPYPHPLTVKRAATAKVNEWNIRIAD